MAILITACIIKKGSLKPDQVDQVTFWLGHMGLTHFTNYPSDPDWITHTIDQLVDKS